MEIYRCKECEAKFPEVAWIYGQYLRTDHGSEEVYPSIVPNDPAHQAWAEDRLKMSHTVQTPCCPLCHSVHIEKIEVEAKI